MIDRVVSGRGRSPKVHRRLPRYVRQEAAAIVSTFAVSGVACMRPSPQPWVGCQNTSRLYIAASRRNTSPPTTRNFSVEAR